MADDFDSGICSGSWWSAARINSTTAGFDSSGMASSVTDTLMPPISGFGLSPAPPMDWNQSLLRSNPHLLQETPNYFRQDSSSSSSTNLVTAEEADHQQLFLLGQQSIYEPTSSLMMGNNNNNNNYEANDSLANFTKLLGTTSPPKHQSGTSSTSNQLQFSNSAPFWNPSPAPVQFVAQSFEQKPNCSSTTTKSNAYSATKKTSSSSEASLKKPRLETPSPLPTFKVRKEKLGDRITALQQLVSPFGKTDTASVLHEAIEYIKFLHEQVNVLSTPYLKNGHPKQHQQNSDHMSKDAGEVTKHDLRSWGLCLVPTESIYPVASETMTDFWTPSFGGTYR